MQIRKYNPSDREQVIELVSEILRKLFNGDPAQFEYVKELDVTKNYLLYLVTEIDNKIIATMAVKKLNKDEVRLKRIYVNPIYRRRGIAQKLLNQLVEFAKQQGYKKMILSTYPVMKNAGRFYKRNKFKEFDAKPEEQIHVIKEL